MQRSGSVAWSAFATVLAWGSASAVRSEAGMRRSATGIESGQVLALVQLGLWY